MLDIAHPARSTRSNSVRYYSPYTNPVKEVGSPNQANTAPCPRPQSSGPDRPIELQPCLGHSVASTRINKKTPHRETERKIIPVGVVGGNSPSQTSCSPSMSSQATYHESSGAFHEGQHHTWSSDGNIASEACYSGRETGPNGPDPGIHL